VDVRQTFTLEELLDEPRLADATATANDDEPAAPGSRIAASSARSAARSRS